MVNVDRRGEGLVAGPIVPIGGDGESALPCVPLTADAVSASVVHSPLRSTFNTATCQ